MVCREVALTRSVTDTLESMDGCLSAGAYYRRLCWGGEAMRDFHAYRNARLTGFGGCSALALTAERLGLFKDLAEGVRVKVRRLGASDGESLWALAASLAADAGASTSQSPTSASTGCTAPPVQLE